MSVRPAALVYPHAEAPAPGAVIEVARGVFWLRTPLPFALNHINLWLLEDGDGYSIVDCGYGTEPTHELWRTVIAQVTRGAPIRRIIVTHYHPDHVGSAAWLAQEHRASVWMSESEFFATHAAREGRAGFARELAIAYFVRHGLDAERAKAQATRGNAYARGVPAMVEQYRRILEGEDIAIGADSWRVIVGRGHAPEHAMLHCAARGILISGDQVLPRITTNVGVWPSQPDGNPLKLFLDTMHKLESLPADTLVLPSHDRVFRGLHARLASLREHHAARLAEIHAACGAAVTAAQLVPTLFRRQLDDHQLIFAMGEAIAHLNYLLYQGKLARTLDADGCYRFVASSEVSAVAEAARG